ncbi:alcohol dehydrogenase [Fluviicoccus keumensis]|uniref:Alcohol dehydrogenase n=1 Tax=Fluviicoccus keumensis TaxID=1435465 RepID=A0A4Q7ZBF7_9GAMM|nr:iron-containing alcohol dehydrogenase [Fluviicoccus keumensis]RZU47947.1 alcohol dehydrogenase [Fluviicoccus keumensis]
MTPFTFTTVKTVISESGSSARLGEIAAGLGITRALIVTDPGIVQCGLLEPALASLAKAGIPVTIYSDVVADPPEAKVLDSLQMARDAGIDGVIGLGGGSSMDVAKVIALLTKSAQTLPEVYGVGNAKGTRLPLIQVPTTAGTGSEVTPIAIITTGETTKTGIVSPLLYADVALLDADLTLGLPPAVTAATGIDAMVHAIEAYTSKIRKNPYSDVLAREALRLLAANLVTVVEDGRNREARQAVLFGAMLAGQAFANAPVAAVHALAYPLGGHYHISHGLSNSLVLPAVLRFNLPAAAPLYAELMTVLEPEAEGTEEELAVAFVAAMTEQIAAVKLPVRLRDLNVPEADLPMLARDALLQQRLLVNNPREVSEADALAIYREVY